MTTVFAAAADTLHAVGPGVFKGSGGDFVGEWHDFYLLTGTAAVTLVGLLFLSLSFNLDILLHDRNAHLLQHARQTMLDFIYILVLSLLFLIPTMRVGPLGFAITLQSLVLLVTGGIGAVRMGLKHGGDSDVNVPRRRQITAFLVYALIAFIGFRMMKSREIAFAYALVGLVCTLIGNSVGSAWHLLVEVGKRKIRAEHEAKKA